MGCSGLFRLAGQHKKKKKQLNPGAAPRPAQAGKVSQGSRVSSQQQGAVHTSTATANNTNNNNHPSISAKQQQMLQQMTPAERDEYIRNLAATKAVGGAAAGMLTSRLLAPDQQKKYAKYVEKGVDLAAEKAAQKEFERKHPGSVQHPAAA